MSLVQHICTFFCFGCHVQNFFFRLLAFNFSYQLILCLFEAFQFYARTSHPLKKCGWKSRANFSLVCRLRAFVSNSNRYFELIVLFN